MMQQASRKSRSGRQTFIVGFDFGTHSTKVVYRERGEGEGEILSFDGCSPGYVPHASPSLVRQLDGRLYFGAEALNRSEGKLHRSLKVNLLCPTGDLQIDRESRLLVAAYFAWAFQRVRDMLPHDGAARVLINVAAPMSHFEDPVLSNRYLQIIQTAWKLTFESQVPFEQGMPQTEAFDHLNRHLDGTVLSDEERKFAVLPETIAPIVSLAIDPWMEAGMYMIIDVGAGTTEMAVFHAKEPGGDQHVLCYCDETYVIGGNDLHLVEQFQDARRDAAMSDILTRLEKFYRRVWYSGYQLDSANTVARRRWKQLHLILSGGGTRHPEVADYLADVNPLQPWPEHETRCSADRHVPGLLEESNRMHDDELSLFAVANGLAIDRGQWPVVFQPNQVEPLASSTIEVEKPEAYWYV